MNGSTIPSGTLLNPLPRGPMRYIQLIPTRMKVMVWTGRVQIINDEASRVSSMVNNALICEGNCEITRTIETGMQIMSQSPAKIHEPHDICEAGCNAIQIAGSTKIRPWLMQR